MAGKPLSAGITPEEQASSDRYEASRSEQNAADIRKELERTKDPKARSVLEQELRRYEPRPAQGPRLTPLASVLHNDQYADWFEVDEVRKGVPKKGAEPLREAKIGDNWIRVEATGHQIRDGKPVRVARLGKYAPGWMETAEAGAVSRLGGLPWELGEAIAAYRGGPGAGAALEQGRRRELGLKYPRVIGTSAEKSKAFMLGGLGGGLATDPTSMIGLRAGPAGMGVMGAVSGAGSETAEQLRSGEIHPGAIAVGGMTGGAFGLGLGLAIPGAVKLVRWLRGAEKESANIPAEERKRIFMEALSKNKPAGVRGGEEVLTDEQIDKINAELDERARKYGTSPSKPRIKPKLKAQAKDKTIQEGPISSPDEGNLDDVLPLGGRKVEPPVGELPEPPKPEFTMEGEPPPEAGARVKEFPDIPRSTDPKTGKPRLVGMPQRINFNKDSLNSAIAKLGGVSMEHRLDITGGKEQAGRGWSSLFKTKGKKLDALVDELDQYGYIPPEAKAEADGGVQWLRDAIRDEMEGRKQHWSMRADENAIYSRMRDERGGATPELLARIATSAGGAATGAYLDPEHPIAGAVTGAAVGMVIPSLAKRIVAGGPASMLTMLAKRDPVLAAIAREPADQAEANIAAKARETYQNWKGIKDLNLAPQDNEIIVHAIQAGRIDLLPPQLQVVARQFKLMVDRLGTQAQQIGVIPQLGRNYVPQMWDTTDKATKAILERLGYQLEREGREGFSTFTPFALPRNIPSYQAGVAMGLKPKTYDLADIYAMYASSVNRAIENSRALSMVKRLQDPAGRPLVGIQGQVPREYVALKNVPDLADYRVHPEIAESLDFALGSHDLNRIERGLLGVSFGAKRFNTMYSAFHAKSLLEAYTLAGGNPIGVAAGIVSRGTEKLGGPQVAFKSAVDSALEAYRKGGARDAVDFLVRNGLSVRPPIEDVSKIEEFHKVLNSSGMGGLTKLDKSLQTFTWEYLHTGMKLATAMRLFEREVIKNPTRDPNLIAADVSKFVNRTFGGLNWRREVEEVQNKFLYRGATDFFNARGLAWQQIMMFAPDWTWSTFASWAKAIPGVESSQITRELHQRYVAMTTLAQLTVADGVNYALSGHHLWDNAQAKHDRSLSKQQLMTQPNWREVLEGMLYIDLGDGRRMNFMKHGLEVPHMIANPEQFWLNKLGYVPRVVLEGALNKEWLSDRWSPQITGEPGTAKGEAERWLLHPLRRTAPFGAQQMMEQGPESIGGFFGFPITGMTPEESIRRSLDERLKRMQR